MFHGEQQVPIDTPFIKLDSLLKLSGLCMTGGEAKIRIAEGQVLVNGAVCTQRGRKIVPGDKVECSGQLLAVTRHAP